MTILTRLERKIGWITIGQLPLYLVSAQVIFYIWGRIDPTNLQPLIFDPYAVLEAGQYWRLFTFLFIVPLQHPIFAFFYLYLLYIYGMALEREWGSFGFTLFYLIGALGTVVGTLLVASMSPFYVLSGSLYLNLSIFLAFAAVHPDFIIHLFFIIPVKIKWLAWFTMAGIIYSFVMGHIFTKMLIAVSLSNYILFFGQSHIENIKQWIRLQKHRQKFRNWGDDDER